MAYFITHIFRKWNKQRVNYIMGRGKLNNVNWGCDLTRQSSLHFKASIVSQSACDFSPEHLLTVYSITLVYFFGTLNRCYGIFWEEIPFHIWHLGQIVPRWRIKQYLVLAEKGPAACLRSISLEGAMEPRMCFTTRLHNMYLQHSSETALSLGLNISPCCEWNIPQPLVGGGSECLMLNVLTYGIARVMSGIWFPPLPHHTLFPAGFFLMMEEKAIL